MFFFFWPLTSHLFLTFYPAGILSWWGTEECAVVMETQSQTSSAAEKKKRVETIIATKSASTRADISEKAVASSTTSNGIASTLQLQSSFLITCQAQTSILYSFCLFVLFKGEVYNILDVQIWRLTNIKHHWWKHCCFILQMCCVQVFFFSPFFC